MIKTSLIAGLTAFTFQACSTIPPSKQTAVEASPVTANVPKRLYYTLRAEPAVPGGGHLPSRTDIFVDWHYDDDRIRSYLGFRGWDFSGEGRFDMVEVLGEDGGHKAYLYDFDRVGRPRLEEQGRPASS